MVARRTDRLDRLAAEIERDYNVRAQAISADLTDAAARDRLIEEVEGTGLNVDVLVNNAGFGTNGPFHELDQERELQQIRLNCEALVHLSRTFLPGMVERNRGGIINVASTAAFQPVPFMATYGATKAFVLSFSEAVSDELAGTDVTVTAVHPGPVPTEFPGIAGTDGRVQSLPEFTKVSPEKVAASTVKAFARGRRGTIPGLFYNLLIYSSRPLPTTVKLPVMRRMFEP